jgi:hypothetical protein
MEAMEMGLITGPYWMGEKAKTQYILLNRIQVVIWLPYYRDK